MRREDPRILAALGREGRVIRVVVETVRVARCGWMDLPGLNLLMTTGGKGSQKPGLRMAKPCRSDAEMVWISHSFEDAWAHSSRFLNYEANLYDIHAMNEQYTTL
jgi:hypothetical protein